MDAQDPVSTVPDETPGSGALDRRRFFRRTGLAWAGAALGGQLINTATASAEDREYHPIPNKDGEKAVEALPFLEEKEHPSGIPRRRFGKGDDWISILGVGGFSIGSEKTPEQEGIAIVQSAVDQGVNFMDNAWEYNKHVSEERMGKALGEGGRRDEVFLMRKKR